ncbi:hypothetical protein KL930_004678 [Ogataea haglerorum]|nr:hypothetical protein KL932_004200 [Ogataea haglerorum]KAG7773204.1 hypothetical protein KL930_004678 [Ogataea haglerorum]KAG7780149.1 hypothetical protein KL922_001434 [Ogataea haglerorum]
MPSLISAVGFVSSMSNRPSLLPSSSTSLTESLPILLATMKAGVPSVNVNEIHDSKEQVASPFGLVDENWGEHHHGKVGDPVGTRGDGGGHCSSSQSIDFWWVHPWERQDGEGEDGNEQEETNSGSLGGLLVLLDQTTKSNDEGDTLTCGTNQEERSSSESVDQEEGWNGEDCIDNGEDTAHDKGLSSGKVQSVLEQDSGVINRRVTAGELLEELGTGSQHHSSEVLVLSSTEQLFETELGVVKSIDRVGNHGGFGNDTVIVRINAVDSSQNESSLFHSSLVDEPSWRLWQTYHKQKQPQGKQDLQSNWQPPRNRTLCVGQTKVDPIGNESTNSNHRTFQVDQTTPVLWLGVLGLPHRNGGGVHTVTDTSDRSGNDEVAQLPVRLEWENGNERTDDDDHGTEYDDRTPSKTFTPNHSKQSTKETSNLVASSHDTLDDGSMSRVTTDGWELILELGSSDDTAHKTLVVAKQAETHHGRERNGPSELSATETECVVFVCEAVVANSQAGLFKMVCG